jgi:lipoprotein-anchoring transpeptidase ErfK/SrfK
MKFRFALLLLAVCVAGCDRAPLPVTEPDRAPSTAPAPLTPPAAETPPPAAVPATVIPEQYREALTLKNAGQLQQARELLQPLADAPDPAEKVLDLLSEINTQILFSPAPAPQKVDYTIQPGDTLGKLARQFGTTIELIKRSNGLKSDLIRVGDRLRIYQPKFAVTVSKTANTLTVTDDGGFFKRYRVGTGEYAKTPVGQFKVTDRIHQPPWWREDKVIPFGDPENILGTHWLGLDIRGYGIHGTWEPESIGTQATAGCIRLLNEHVEELYIMLPSGTPVTIHE